jgi:hypothetical protein
MIICTHEFSRASLIGILRDRFGYKGRIITPLADKPYIE